MLSELAAESLVSFISTYCAFDATVFLAAKRREIGRELVII